MNPLQVSARNVTVTPLRNPRSPADTFALFKDRPHSFFLDSGMDHERLGRYSFVGAEPFLVVSSRGREIELRRADGRETVEGSPFEQLRSLLAEYRAPREPHPVPFIGGAVGYLSYDLCHFIEKLPATTTDDMAFPEMYFGFHDRALCYDHMDRTWHAVHIDVGRDDIDFERWVHSLEERLNEPVVAPEAGTGAVASAMRTSVTRDEYLEAVRRAKDYITAGDIFQVNLSQRFQAEVNVPPYELYRRLRRINPAPFACYMAFDDMAVVGSSPERFLKVVDGHVETRPIKGTRPRQGDAEFDERMRRELLSSEKDIAELTMIVDLERNDLGRVCSYGSVRVTEPVVLEEYPSVYHLVATVEGDLHEGHDIVDLLKATFPGGSITGAPKIRAMEIIDELEPTRRSVYTGAMGYIGFDGRTDLNIVIRTILMRGREAFLQVGGGIVADSVPVMEYEETLHKGRALFEALGQAEQ